jgi:hypothetical protein
VLGAVLLPAFTLAVETAGLFAVGEGIRAGAGIPAGAVTTWVASLGILGEIA